MNIVPSSPAKPDSSYRAGEGLENTPLLVSNVNVAVKLSPASELSGTSTPFRKNVPNTPPPRPPERSTSIMSAIDVAGLIRRSSAETSAARKGTITCTRIIPPQHETGGSGPSLQPRVNWDVHSKRPPEDGLSDP